MYSIHLHEEARDKGLPDVDVVVAAGEVGAGSAQVEAVHDARQLLPYVVRAFQGTEVDEVVVTPLRILMVCGKRNMVKYQQCIIR